MQYLVAYAKIVVDKTTDAARIELAGVFFGGIGETQAEAEAIAKECVNTIRGGTILPRVVKLEGDGQLIEALYDATERFERIAANMIEADAIITKRKK